MGWVLLASMDEILSNNPGWTEEQCRAEFDKIYRERMDQILAEQEERRAKRAANKAAKLAGRK